ncbi:MAG TPA: Smr/MutS family protein [Opitutaceae bacterium]|nr:Smr/MutS family protein [Opitutaceae bacterium]
MEPEEDLQPVPFRITGELDLHTFRPSDLGELIPAYLEACQQAGILQVRIVHGKGTGTLRETVHHLLRRSPLVRHFRLADEFQGSWGATQVTLVPMPSQRPPIPLNPPTGDVS